MASILDMIGNTPIIRLNEIEKSMNLKAHLYAKLEYFNPFGSIKDRAALRIIRDAEKRILIESKILVEASSGNLGIAISAISNILGYKSIIVMPENMSSSRFKLLKKYGATIVTSNESSGMGGAIKVAQQMAKNTGGYYCDQFNNHSSIEAHILSTAPEIDISLSKNIDAVICGIGSGGTISGVGQYFKSQGYKTKIYGVEPDVFPHGIQGIGAGFVPKILDETIIDEIYKVNYDKAICACNTLLRLSSIFVGISSGAVLEAGIEIAKRREYENKNIVLIFADSGERYI